MRPTPKVIQALPLPSVERRRPIWPHLVVVGFLLGIALLNGLVPRVAEILAGWL